jgi:DNA-binding transcriptional regulator YiaG
MKDKYESEMLQVIHEDMKGMNKLGIVSNAEMCKFDKLCLTQAPQKKHKIANSARTERTGNISAKSAGTA